MLQEQVAVHTVDFVLGDVLPVEQLGVAVLLEPHGLVVTRDAALARDIAGAPLWLRVAPRAVHAELLGLRVVERDGARADLLLGIQVTKRAPRGSLARLLPLEVAEDARRGGDRDVAPLDDLRVAGRAAQRLSAPHFDQVGRVVEQDVADHLLPHEEASIMAAEACCVLDFGPRVRPVCAREVAGDHRESLELLSYLGGDAGRDVALDAGDVLM